MTNTIKQKLIKDRMINKLLNRIEDDLKKYSFLEFNGYDGLFEYIDAIIYREYKQIEDTQTCAKATRELFDALYKRYITQLFPNRNGYHIEILYKREVF